MVRFLFSVHTITEAKQNSLVYRRHWLKEMTYMYVRKS